jgi:hypothetical protein
VTISNINTPGETIQLVFWSFVTDASVVQLAELARQYLFAIGYESVSVVLNAGGADRAELPVESKDWTAPRFNVIGVRAVAGNPRRSLYSRLELSPGNMLWFHTDEFPENNRTSRQMKLSLETKERSLKIGQIAEPSVLFLDSGLDVNSDAWEKAKRALSQALRQTDIPLDVTGFAEVSSRIFPFFPSNLGPDAGRQLGDKFDSWHPMLIGPSEKCARFRDSVAEEYRSRIKSEWLRDDHAFSMLMIDVELSEAVRHFFVDKDAQPESNKELAGYMEAESVDVGGSKRFTLRGWREMSAKGFLPKVPNGRVLHPIILPKYGESLGITQDEMLVELMQEPLSATIQTEINQHLSSAMNPNSAEAILNGHFEVYKKYLVDPAFRSELERVIRARYPAFRPA